VFAIWQKGGGVSHFGRWGSTQAELHEGDFVRLAPGESWIFKGHTDVLHEGGLSPSPAPRWVAAGLRFERKGNHLGLGAWVGTVWGKPISLGEKPVVK
jgi:hypothetical protein